MNRITVGTLGLLAVAALAAALAGEIAPQTIVELQQFRSTSSVMMDAQASPR